MFLPRPDELTPLGKKYETTSGFLHGEDERGIFKLAFDYSMNATLTATTHRAIDRFVNAGEGIDQERVTPDEAFDQYGVKIDKTKSLDEVKYLAQLQNISTYIENQIAVKRDTTSGFGFWKDYMGGILAGSLFDPVLLFAGSATGGAAVGLARAGKASKVANALFSSNPYIKHGTRIGAFGVPEAGLSVAQGYNFSKQLNHEYDNGHAVIDGFVGLIFGTALSGLFLRGIDSVKTPIPKVPSEGEEIITPLSKIPDEKGKISTDLPPEFEEIISRNKYVADETIDTGPKRSTSPDDSVSALRRDIQNVKRELDIIQSKPKDKTIDLFVDTIFEAYANSQLKSLPDNLPKFPEIEEFMEELLNYASHNGKVSEVIITQTQDDVRNLMKESIEKLYTPREVKQRISDIIDNMDRYLRSDEVDLKQRTFEEDLNVQAKISEETLDYTEQESFDELIDAIVTNKEAS